MPDPSSEKMKLTAEKIELLTMSERDVEQGNMSADDMDRVDLTMAGLTNFLPHGIAQARWIRV